MSQLWQEFDDEEICTECGNFPAIYLCKVCKQPMCMVCSRRLKGVCSECESEREYREMEKE